MYILSNSHKLLRAERTNDWINTYAELGDMPLLFTLPAMRYASYSRRLLNNNKLNWVAIVDHDFAKAVSRHDHVVYLGFPAKTKDPVVEPLSTELVTDLQACLPELLQCVISQAWDIPIDAYMATPNHVLGMYQFISDMLGCPTTELAHELIHTVYQAPPPPSIIMFPNIRNKRSKVARVG
jgi:hypothetical protein